VQIILAYDTGNGPVQVTTSPWVLMQWEREYKRKYADLIDGTPSLEDWVYMAWRSAVAAGQTVPADLDGFAAGLVSVRVVGVEPSTPTPPVASGA
jgi:hypothetical protein